MTRVQESFRLVPPPLRDVPGNGEPFAHGHDAEQRQAEKGEQENPGEGEVRGACCR